MTIRLALLALAVGGTAGCGDDPCDAQKNTGCEDGQACEVVAGSEEPKCEPAVLVTGRVFDTATNKGIAGAKIVALDANGASASFVATSDADGKYKLPIPTSRNPDGSPNQSFDITLRADAKGYAPFPGGIRPALPFSTGSPTLSDGAYRITSSLTDIGLIAIDAAGTGTVSGTVEENPTAASAIVVAEINGQGFTAVAARSGDYTIFNVPVGDVTVQAYAVGHNYVAKTVTVAADKTVDADIELGPDAAATVSGNVSIVNGEGGIATSVILVLESTFNDVTGRGETVPGLRAPAPGEAPNITNQFAIAGVPAGKYIVLAGFENDDLVRDVSGIGGTAIVHQEVLAATDVTIGTTFKVTGSVDIVAPGATGIEMVNATPTFTWVDDSSEDHYAITVFDSLGTAIWTTTTLKGVVTVGYGGPALAAGQYYQFKVQSIDGSGAEIAKTEDLRGVFLVQ